MEPKLNLAKILGGSCIFGYRGMLLESKAGLVAQLTEDFTPIPIDGIDEQSDQRTKGFGYKITVVAAGRWENQDRMLPYLDMPTGRFIVPVLPISTISTGDDELTIVKHGLFPGDRVMFECRDDDGILPAIVSAGTHYYVSVVDDDTLQVHATKADALAATSPLNFADDGTGIIMLIGQFPLEIWGEDGEKLTFGSVAITKQPDIDLSSSKTVWGSMEFEAYLQHRKKFSDSDAVYAVGAEAFPGWNDTDAEDILTQSPWVAWAEQLVVETGDIDLTDNEIDYTAHGLSTGDIVYVGTTGTLPATAPALDPETKYYVRAVSANAISLHTTSAGATADTGQLDFSNAGTGRHWLTINNPSYSLMDTKMGIKVAFPVSFEDRPRDRFGVVNRQLKSSRAEATFVPYELSAQKVLGAVQAQGSGVAIGRSASAASKPLNIFAAGQFIRILGAKPSSAAANWKQTDDRAGEVKFINTRRVVSGVLQAVAIVGDEIP